MTVLAITQVGDPVLRERAREVTAEELASPAVQRLIDDMIETKRVANGAGIAANQVGEPVATPVPGTASGSPHQAHWLPMVSSLSSSPRELHSAANQERSFRSTSVRPNRR